MYKLILTYEINLIQFTFFYFMIYFLCTRMIVFGTDDVWCLLIYLDNVQHLLYDHGSLYEFFFFFNDLNHYKSLRQYLIQDEN